MNEIIMKKKCIMPVFLLSIFCIFTIPAQEALHSDIEQYYDFTALQGISERPYLNYRTLSDSVWKIDAEAEHPWKGQNLGNKRNIYGDIYLRIYGPELFNSYNTLAPYGQYDGTLWQGKGLNTSLTGGARLEGYGVELTFKPQLAFSMNLDFDTMQSYDSEYGYFWGYGNGGGIDSPQRFGNEPIFAYDWGDSEIRYTWKTLTIGFGTQAIWLGPAHINPILHSNNAPTYPKLDIGLRKQKVVIPKLNWDIGDVEFRLWVGYLTESDYFDNDNSNNHNMFHGLSFAYAPSFLPWLTLSANRVCLVPWEWENLKFILPLYENTIEDQKASFAASFFVPKGGIEVYGEFGIDDYVSGGMFQYVRNPFHTTIYTTGLKKTFNILPGKQIYGELICEANWFEMTADYYTTSYSFFFHHLIAQGYTNKGQWLGSGSILGGNSQYVGFSVYYPKGNSLLFISRNNPDNNYLYGKRVDPPGSYQATLIRDNKANFFIGLQTYYFINANLSLSGGIVYDMIINPMYKRADDELRSDIHKHNFSFQIGMKYSI
jgi:hypothetical protein